MICETQTGTLAIVFELDPTWEYVIGGHRFGRVHESIQAGLYRSLWSSVNAASSGAMRGPMRPEVLIDQTGRML